MSNIQESNLIKKRLTFIDSSKAAHSLFNDLEFDFDAILTPLEKKNKN